MTPTSWSPHLRLDPTPPEARDWLQEELHGSDYQSPWLDSVIRSVLDLIRGFLDSLATLAAFSPAISVLLALVVIALLVWVLPRVRRESTATSTDAAVLADLTIPSSLYRERAARALREGRYDDAVLDGFRALAKDMSDRTLLDDAPGRTAHEVSVALASTFPDHADRLAHAANLFDSVRYGHRRANADQAAQVQRLDAELVTTRPAPTPVPLQDLTV